MEVVYSKRRRREKFDRNKSFRCRKCCGAIKQKNEADRSTLLWSGITHNRT